MAGDIKGFLVKQLNPSFTKPLGTSTFCQGEGRPDTFLVKKDSCPNEREIL